MPGIVKRRKAVVAPATKGGLSNYAKISKATTTLQIVIEKNHLIDGKILTPTKEVVVNARKRRLSVDVEEMKVALDNKRLKTQPPRKLVTPSTPNMKFSSQRIESLPSKTAADLFGRLRIASQPQPSQSSPLSSSFEASTPKLASDELPGELSDLIDLHTSLLTTLSIHYAHNGIDTPADLRSLCPDIARSWGKRKVHVEDVQRSIGVLEYESLGVENIELSLSDYGHGKICVEMHDAGKINVMQPINENDLNARFQQNLRKLWAERQQGRTLQTFIASLPQQDIRINPSLTKISPLLAKGQQRLASFKSDLVAKQDAKTRKVEERKSGPPAKLTLLERLRLKQEEQSAAAPGMTKEQIARRAALGRMEEVVSVLSIMTSSGNPGQSRVSFTIGTIVGKLKDSFRTPISKDEAESCLRVLAAEVAPQWVKVVQMGKVEALVVHREMRMAKEEIGRKTQELRRI